MKMITQRRPSLKKETVHVALSGGVDSAVAAMLLLKKGYSVTGVFMKNWSGEEYGLEDECPWKQDQADAEAVCDHLGIEFKTYNFEKEYRENVISNFFDEYRRGNTPNPDILCNNFIKFGTFLKRSLEEGADLIATGHYARKTVAKGNTISLTKARDSRKDQTYFLYRLTQKQLTHTLFPLGDLTKEEVRVLARKVHLPNADKEDSQGICFVGKVDLQEFLSKEIRPDTGPIIDADTGTTIGTHRGVAYYTLGQREGLGVGGAEEPYFVSDKDISKNTLYAVMGKHNPALWISSCKISDIHWIASRPPNGPLASSVRYRQKPQKCTYDKNIITFDSPVWIPSPSQSAVLYDGENILGGGIIDTIERISK